LTDVPAEHPVTARHHDGVTVGTLPSAVAAAKASRASPR
jgi:hypothetical protein